MLLSGNLEVNKVSNLYEIMEMNMWMWDDLEITVVLHETNLKYGKCKKNTGWPKSNVSKVRAYYSASDHLIGKIFSGVHRDSHWFEGYLKIIEIGDYFFE